MILIVTESTQTALVISRALNATDETAPSTYAGANETVIAIEPGFIAPKPLGETLHNSPFKEALPLIPKKYAFGVRTVDTDGHREVSAADRAEDERLRTLFDAADEVVFASDGGADAQARFHNICQHYNVGVPTSRVWLTRLEYMAVRKAYRSRAKGRHLHDLAQSGLVAMAMDALFEYNMEQAFASAYGKGAFPLHRQDVIALDFISKSLKQVASFERGAPKHTVSVTAEIYGHSVNMSPVDVWEDKAVCEEIFSAIRINEDAPVAYTELIPHVERASELYVLATLQADACEKLHFSPSKTLALATSLYERGLISSPLTSDSRLPESLRRPIVRRYPSAKEFVFSKLSDTKTHGIITTERNPVMIPADEAALRQMIIENQEKAFAAPRRYAELVVCTEVNGIDYAGSCEVDADLTLPDDGVVLKLTGKSTSTFKAAQPGPLKYSDVSLLLAACQYALRSMLQPVTPFNLAEDEYGTVVERLVENGYISVFFDEVRLTEKGRLLLLHFKDSDIVTMLNRFKFEAGDLYEGDDTTGKSVMRAFENWLYTEVSRLLADPKLSAKRQTSHTCPRCKKAQMTAYNKTVRCEGCGYALPRYVNGLELSDKHLEQLVVHGYTSPIYGFIGRKGHKFTEALVLDSNFGVTFAPKSAKIY